MSTSKWFFVNYLYLLYNKYINKNYAYGTIIVDERTHNPIAILDGRDGKSLLKWLDNFTEAEQSRLKLIYKIQEMTECGYQ